MADNGDGSAGRTSAEWVGASAGGADEMTVELASAAWSVAEVREAEERLFARLPTGELMRRAAFGLATRCAEILKSRRGGVYGARIAIVAGKGNNGGDARLAGEFLAQRGAIIIPVGWSNSAVKSPISTAEFDHPTETQIDLILDGLVGIGGRGPLRPPAAKLASWMAQLRADGAYVVAVDIPSGVLADTGEIPGAAVIADETVTFGCLKPGLVLTPGAWHTGDIIFVDIGLELEKPPVLHTTNLSAHWPRPGPADTKYTRGVVGVVAGSEQYPGAAYLAVRGALAGTSGMVRYVGPVAVVSAHPEVVATTSISDAGRVQAWVVGPGFPVDDKHRALVSEVLASRVPVVVDAGGLGSLTDGARAKLSRRRAPTILTPHEGEFSRLFGPITDGRLKAANAAARSSGTIVVLKGDRTIVTDGGRPAWVGPAGASALASAGTGDLLAGLIGSLLSSGMAPMLAAALAVTAHAEAAVATAGSRVTATGIADKLAEQW